ncbi:MAG TPA: DUF2520 domain-containing protein [Kofleriaceae bacterium]|nr:DUF2520 domain-containing protein [Kofleriaceae bacterium]
MTARTPNVFVVGAGPVATALAGALRLGGVPVLGLWARTPARARAAGAVAGVAAFSAAPPDLLLEADVVVLAVRDDAITDVARMLVATGLVNRHHTLIHCSGAVSAAEALAPVTGEVGGMAMMHPLRAIPDGRAAMRTMKGAMFGIEGDERGRRDAQALVAAMGARALELGGVEVAAYHAAAAIASNYLVVLLALASDLLAQVGIAPEQAREALVALADGTLANLRERGIDAALTGPIRRGDRATIERHLAALSGRPELAQLYRALGRHAAALARRAPDPAPSEALDAVEALLAEPAPAAGDAADLRTRKAR